MGKGKIVGSIGSKGQEEALRVCMCITMPNGDIVVFKADERYWYEPCWAIPGQDKEGNPTVRFMPVQKYGMSKVVEPFLREHYLCIYPAEPGIEEHYDEFVRLYHNYIDKEMN